MVMKMYIQPFFWIFLTSSTIIACGVKSSSSTSSAPDVTGSKVASNVGIIGQAMASGATQTGIKTSTSLALVLTSYDSDCDPNKSGWPKNFGSDTGAAGGSKEYNAAFMSCLLKEPDVGGDTIMGAFANAAGTICAIGDQLVFDDQPHTITSYPITAACFPASFINYLTTNNIVVNGSATVTASKTTFLANTSGKWTASVHIKGSISVQGVAHNTDTLYLIADNGTVFSLAKADGPDFDTTISAPYDRQWVVQIDKTNGYLKYEGWMQEYPLASPPQGATNKNRHSRVVLQGTLGSDGTFSALSNVQILYSNLWKGTGSATDSASFKSMAGNPTTGYTLQTYEATSGSLGAIASYSNKITACVAASGSVSSGACTGNAGLTMTTNADTAFGILPSTTTTALAWWTNLIPPAYTTVATTELQVQ